MKYSTLILALLFAVAGCSRMTHLPSHNLQASAGKSATSTLVLTDLAPAERIENIDRFLDTHGQQVSHVVLASGDAVSSQEKKQALSVLLARGMAEEDISPRNIGEGPDFCLVFQKKDPATELDNWWFSNAAASPEFAKSTHYNIQAQLADKNDLTRPRALAPENSHGAIGAVGRYQSGQRLEPAPITANSNSDSES